MVSDCVDSGQGAPDLTSFTHWHTEPPPPNCASAIRVDEAVIDEMFVSAADCVCRSIQS